jgi:plastocyanin
MRTTPDSPGKRRHVAAATLVAALVAVLLAGAVAPAAGGRPHQGVERRAKTVQVAISGFAYHPPTLKVKRGAKVVFANGDRVPHTATRRGSFDTGHIAPGHSSVVTLRRAGVYAYHCTIHPFMHGKIVVR